jgi:hypothetical protein
MLLLSRSRRAPPRHPFRAAPASPGAAAYPPRSICLYRSGVMDVFSRKIFVK